MPKEKKESSEEQDQKISSFTRKSLTTMAGIASATYLFTKIFCSFSTKTNERLVCLISAIAFSIAVAYFYKPSKHKDRYFLAFLNGLLVFCTVSGFTAATNFVATKGNDGVTVPHFARSIFPDPAAQNLVNILKKQLDETQKLVAEDTQVPKTVKTAAGGIARQKETSLQKSLYYQKAILRSAPPNK